MKLATLLATIAASVLAVGCAVEPADEMIDEGTDVTSDEVRAASLVGTWAADTGPIYKIEFTKETAPRVPSFRNGDKVFNATFDSGIRCVAPPCDEAQFESSGIYRTKSSTLSLRAYDKPSRELAQYLGEYSFRVRGEALSIEQKDGTVKGTFHKVVPVKCGTTTCGVGLVCCNPLRNICTKPGMMCIQ